MRPYALIPTALLSISLAPAVAHADTLVVTGEGNTYTFTLPANPTPIVATPGAFFVTAPTTTDNIYDELGFGSATYAADLGLIGNSATQINFSGPQLYSGTEAAPTLLTGTFSLVNEADNAPYTATIDGSTTPEPSSLLLLGTGLAGLTAFYRRRQQI